ncbi:MAG: phage holin family protein [Methylococcales bacterium]|nr:phage holin family protein [Methylococcales bacterium]MDP3010331.1 phage holin family protein [Methylococcales bacterium]
MKPNAANDATIEQTATHNDPIGSNVLDDIQLLWYELQGLIYEYLQLAVLEARRAGESLVTMIIAGVMVAVLMIGAWLGLMVAAVLMMIEQGMVASTAILLAVIVNLLIALLLCGVIRRKSHYLQFPALLGSVKPMPPTHRDTDKLL